MKTFILVFLFTALSAFADNGSGYNGPVMKGLSIPLDGDRDYSHTELSEATRVCLLDGDKSDGLVSLSERVFEFFSSGRYDSLNAKNKSPSFFRDFFRGDGSEFWFFTMKSFDKNALQGWLSKESTFSVVLSEFKQRDPEPFTIKFGFKGPLFDRLPDNHRALNIKYNFFPVFKFAREDFRREYDRLGREVRYLGTYYKSVSIYLPKGFDESAHFVNADTGEPTPILVSLSEYVQCLQDQLTKAAQ